LFETACHGCSNLKDVGPVGAVSSAHFIVQDFARRVQELRILRAVWRQSPHNFV
jgi:hypothetical protein